MATQIKRKPVPCSVQVDSKAQFTASPIVQSPSDESPPPAYDASDKDNHVEPSTIEGEVRPDLDDQLEHLHLETDHNIDLSSPITETIPEQLPTPDATPPSPKPSKFKHALGEIKHFAGGLISQPYEATKHFSILRHSHGFVFYQGPSTSIAITIFSDQPLPIDRTLWLQKRGFSGKTGLKVGTLGSRSAWIDVTPGVEATAQQIVAESERAWQRDIAKFLKKTREKKNLSNHRACETHIVRIPHVAEDGYFRVVLCAGRKVLCPSPVFRYASSSLDPSILRGASLSTLPLELAIRIGSIVAHTAANTAAAGALQPAVSAVQTAVQPYQYGGATQWAASTAYDNVAAEKVDTTVESINQQYDEKMELQGTMATGVEGNEEAGAVLFPDEGPEPPYPIRFSGKIILKSAGQQNANKSCILGMDNVPQHTLIRLSGAYFGWVWLSKPKGLTEKAGVNESFENWLQAVLFVAIENNEKIGDVERKSIGIHIISGFENTAVHSVKASLMLMGHLRPSPVNFDLQDDVPLAQEVLSREGWQPETVLQKIKSTSSTRSFTERVADARQAGQKQLDRVPVHRLGVRTESMGLKDQLIGNGGVYIKR